MPSTPRDGVRSGSRRPPITAVTFDLGKVLLDWDPAYVLDAETLAAIDIASVQRALDLGQPVGQVRAAARRAHPDRAADIDRYLDRWQQTIAGPIDDVVAVLDDLRSSASVDLYVLSNFSGELFRQARPRFAFLEWFDGLVISGDVGLVKPDPRIYDVLVARYGLTPHQTAFIDDRTENVAAACDAGMVGLHFRSAGALRTELRAWDVLTTG